MMSKFNVNRSAQTECMPDYIIFECTFSKQNILNSMHGDDFTKSLDIYYKHMWMHYVHVLLTISRLTSRHTVVNNTDTAIQCGFCIF